jgi:GNAT superfamily N-acetyltransferase
MVAQSQGAEVGVATLPPRTTYRIRELRDNDIPELISLLRLGLGEGSIPRTREFWDWKHEANPFGRSAGLVAESEGEVVGLRTFLRWRFRCAGEAIAAVRPVDTVTHPRMKRSGVFRGLTEEIVRRVAAEGTTLIFNTPNRLSRHGYLKMGWKDVCTVPLRAKPLRPMRILRALVRPSTSPQRRPPVVHGGVPFAEAIEDVNIDAMVTRTENGRLRTDRSHAFLSWRYGTVPQTPYLVVFDSNRDALALLILRARVRKGLGELAIEDVIATENERGMQTAAALIRDTIRRTDADYVVACCATRTPEHSALSSAGLLPLPLFGPYFVTRILDDRIVGINPLSWRNWRLSLGDLEIF